MPFKILVVEDHPVMRQAYAATFAREPRLELCGMAESAEEAIETLMHLACDLVVVDVALPGIDGIELVRRLRKSDPSMPTVVISGHDAQVVGPRALAAGASAFLSKRELPGMLTATLCELCDGA